MASTNKAVTFQEFSDSPSTSVSDPGINSSESSNDGSEERKVSVELEMRKPDLGRRIAMRRNGSEARLIDANKSMFSDSSIHGFSHAANSKDTNSWRFWALWSFICLGLLTIFIGLRIRDFVESGVSTSFQYNYHEKLRFPKITLCAENVYSEEFLFSTYQKYKTKTKIRLPLITLFHLLLGIR